MLRTGERFMSTERLRVYADTSVFGGAFDEEFGEFSRRFFEQVAERRFRLVISPLIHEELVVAPARVRELLDHLLPHAEFVRITADATRLQAAYISAGIVTGRSSNDALHVAVATVTGCSAIVSWNFRHIVHFEKISLYNEVNAANGYPQLAIHSPREVIEYEDEDL
jgi:predicted nucleic acid-binding protein